MSKVIKTLKAFDKLPIKVRRWIYWQVIQTITFGKGTTKTPDSTMDGGKLLKIGEKLVRKYVSANYSTERSLLHILAKEQRAVVYSYARYGLGD